MKTWGEPYPWWEDELKVAALFVILLLALAAVAGYLIGRRT